jgi:alpha-ketoglutarate-dependent taurine dioxygenase
MTDAIQLYSKIWPGLEHWRRQLEQSPRPQRLRVEDLSAPSTRVLADLRTAIASAGYCCYRGPSTSDANAVLQLCQKLGLRTLDDTLVGARGALTVIGKPSTASAAGAYRPYSASALGWHTDGYANAADASVRAFALHCVRPATTGGANQFVDPRRVLARLVEANPSAVKTLMRDDALTIPANVRGGAVLRAQRSVPVFAADADGYLITRYTARRKHVRWHPDVSAARGAMMDAIAREAEDVQAIVLAPGEGVICANVLHNRSEFVDHAGLDARAYLRGRFFERLE